MDLANSKCVKRKISEENIAVKRSRLSNDETLYKQSATNILHLSDYTLHYILNYLDTTSLYYLSMTCERFNSLVKNDESLWIDVDARRSPNTWQKNRFIWKHAHKNTRSILLAGNRSINVVMSIEKLVVTKMFSSLTILALEHQCIKYCKLNDFPNTIRELSLRWSFIPRHQEFFRFALHAMARLKVLILDHCKWLEASSFVSFCRFPNLEILSLYMCTKLGDDDISSVSVAGRMGFKKLKVVDLRFTGLGDLFLRSFHANTSLQIIYFQNFPATYYMERWQRKIDILEGAKKREGSYISDDEDNNNISKKVLQSRFNITDFDTNDTQTITNSTIGIYRRLYPSDTTKPRPLSVLYKYPYNACTCGFLTKSKTASYETDEVIEESSSSNNSDNDPSDNECSDKPNCWTRPCLERKLEKEKNRQRKNRRRCCGSNKRYFLYPPAEICCGMVVNDSCASPLWCQQEATPSNVIHNWMYKREPRSEFEIELLTYGDKNFRAANHLRCFNCDCEPDIVVVRTNSEGNLEQIQQAVNPNPVIIPNVRETEVGVVIKRMVDLIRWIKRFNYNVDAERVLRGFTKCIDISDLLAPADDRTDFVAELGNLLIEFAKHKQNIYYVLCYHAYCIKDCMIQLLMCKTNEEKKKMLIYFFKNLVYVEKLGSDNSPETSRNNKMGKKVKDFICTPIKRFKTCKYVPNTPYQPLHLKYNAGAEDNGTNISELSFRGFYHVNDMSLEALIDLNLKLLDVTGTNVTPNGIKYFLLENPNCRVIHEFACVCRPNLHF